MDPETGEREPQSNDTGASRNGRAEAGDAAARGRDGDIHVADDVIATLTAQAALEVPELVSFSGGLVGDLSKMLGKRKAGRGVRVQREERGLVLDLFVIVRYGARIPRLAHQVQQRVKTEVERATRLPVGEVNIHVQGIKAGTDAVAALGPNEGGP